MFDFTLNKITQVFNKELKKKQYLYEFGLEIKNEDNPYSAGVLQLLSTVEIEQYEVGRTYEFNGVEIL